MAEKEPTAEQPYRAGDTIATPWVETRERLAAPITRRVAVEYVATSCLRDEEPEGIRFAAADTTENAIRCNTEQAGVEKTA